MSPTCCPLPSLSIVSSGLSFPASGVRSAFSSMMRVSDAVYFALASDGVLREPDVATAGADPIKALRALRRARGPAAEREREVYSAQG